MINKLTNIFVRSLVSVCTYMLKITGINSNILILCNQSLSITKVNVSKELFLSCKNDIDLFEEKTYVQITKKSKRIK